MPFKRLLLGSAAALVLTVPALAADMTYPVKAPMVAVAPMFSWTGFYVGGHAGYGWGDIGGTPGSDSGEIADLDVEGTTEFGTDYILDQFEGYGYDSGVSNPDGWFGGAQIGYNFQFSNNVVVGVEADASFGSLKGGGWAEGEEYVEQNYQYYAPNGEFDTPWGRQDIYEYAYEEIGFSTKIEAFGTVRGRIGYAFDRFLPYFTGGLAWGHVKTRASGYYEEGVEWEDYSSIDDTIPNPSSGSEIYYTDEFSGSSSKTSVGWTIGGGLEYALTDNWTIKAEYLYIDLGNETYSFSTLDGNTVDIEYDTKIQTVKVGVNYKF